MKAPIKRTLSVLLLLSGLFSASAVVAGQPPVQSPMPFSNFDLNSDGLITETEFYQARGERMAAMAGQGRSMRGAANAPSFAALDKNQDGQLTQDEFNARATQMMQRKQGPARMPMAANRPNFSDFDRNADGMIVAEEFDIFHQQRMKNGKRKGQRGYNFQDLDLDRNGFVDNQEFSQHQSGNLPRR